MCSFLKILLFLFPVCLFGTEPGHVDIVNGRVTITAGRVAIGPQSSDVLDGLVGWWKMDDGSGTSAADSVGTNHATFINTPQWKTTDSRQCLWFDGTNAALVTTLTLGFTNRVTVSTWINAEYDNRSGQLLDYPNPFYTYSGINMNPNHETGKMLIGQGPIAQINYGYADRPSTNQWHHFCIVLKRDAGPDANSVYIDGVLQAYTPIKTNAPTGTFASNAGFYIASRGGASLFMRGHLADFRVYARSLASNEVYQIWNATK